MKTELLDKEVLAMYDVRGIQSYIFKSNKAKEIIGASVIVANIITDGLKKYKESMPEDEQKGYLLDWKNDSPTAFIDNSDIVVQMLFAGGGNAYLLFRTGEICSRVNHFMAKYLMDSTYSLNLAVAVVRKTDSYADDYEAINNEMRNIKAYMPLTQPLGSLPFMEADSITGYPISCIKNNEALCTEARLKRQAFPENEDEKIFDNMVTQKGEDSLLAVCHIDGNSMGKRIIDVMSGVTDYSEAIRKMRSLSLSISDTFENAFHDMTLYIDNVSGKINNSSKKLYRKIIVAGDDITFVCNARLAIPAVKKFIDSLGAGSNEGYSACGGLAIFNSHFPFSDAYKVAEACCESAKERAKKNKDSQGKIGNYIDFQLCTNISAAHLKAYRSKHYISYSGKFIARPYYIEQSDDSEEIREKGKAYDIKAFIWAIEYVRSMPRNKAKQLRAAIASGENEIHQTSTFLKSRGFSMDAISDWAVCYDAVEIMDIHVPGIYEDGKDGIEV